MRTKNNNISIPEELELALTACTNLPTLPDVALKIIEASKDPDISLHDVSNIISTDPAIAAKLLKIANSPLYSQRRTLNNLREALTLLGFNASLTIALSFSLQRSVSDSHPIHKSFWIRSILAAHIARLLGTKLKVSRLEDLFLAGLLQDIGMLAFKCLNDTATINSSKDMMHNERIHLEIDKLGVDHADIGAWLLKEWALPEYLIDSVMYSHSLNSAKSTGGDNDMFHFCLAFSGTLADMWLSEKPGELLHSIVKVVKTSFDFSDAEFNDVLIEIDNVIPNASDVFEMNLVNENKREEVLNEARNILLEKSISAIKKSEEDRQYIDKITERVEKIEQESQIDHLTKTYNRQYIENRLVTEFKESNLNKWPLSLAFIDIDNFKVINDKFGHLTGDEVLKYISTFFMDNVRQTDVLARYGGDEFLLMLPGASSETAQSLLERLLALFNGANQVLINGNKVNVSVSVGLSTHQGKIAFHSVKEFIASSDKAVYKAKAKGKNCLAVL